MTLSFIVIDICWHRRR